MEVTAIKDRRAVPDTTAVAPAPAQTSPAETFILALRSGATVEEAERVGEMLLRFREKEEARDAERAFNAAFAQAMLEMPAIAKSKRADRGRAGTFYYAPLEAIMGAAQPVLAKHGLHLGFDVVASGDGASVTVTAIVRHAQGHSIRSSMTARMVKFADANTTLQNQQGTVTGLQRTLAMGILGLAVGGEEEAAPYQAGPDVDVEPLLAKIHAATTPEDLRALKPEIAKLPPGPARVGVINASAKRLEQMEGMDDD